MNSSSELIILGSSFIASIPVKCWNFLSVLLRFFFISFILSFLNFQVCSLFNWFMILCLSFFFLHKLQLVCSWEEVLETCIFLSFFSWTLMFFLWGLLILTTMSRTSSRVFNVLPGCLELCWAAHTNALLVLMPLSLSSIFKYIFKWTMTVCLYSRIYLFYDFTRDHRPLPLS